MLGWILIGLSIIMFVYTGWIFQLFIGLSFAFVGLFILKEILWFYWDMYWHDKQKKKDVETVPPDDEKTICRECKNYKFGYYENDSFICTSEEAKKANPDLINSEGKISSSKLNHMYRCEYYKSHI